MSKVLDEIKMLTEHSMLQKRLKWILNDLALSIQRLEVELITDEDGLEKEDYIRHDAKFEKGSPTTSEEIKLSMGKDEKAPEIPDELPETPEIKEEPRIKKQVDDMFEFLESGKGGNE